MPENLATLGISTVLETCYVIWSTHWFECVCEYSCCWVMLELLRIERERKYKTSIADLPILIIICYYKKAAYIPATSIYPHCPLSHRILLSLWRCYCNISRGTRGIETNVQFQSLAPRLTDRKEKKGLLTKTESQSIVWKHLKVGQIDFIGQVTSTSIIGGGQMGKKSWKYLWRAKLMTPCQGDNIPSNN